MAKLKSLKALALSPLSGFRHITVPVPEWDGITVILRDPSAEAWLRWQDIFKGGDTNNNMAMRNTVKIFDKIAKNHNCLILFVHHINKGNMRHHGTPHLRVHIDHSAHKLAAC